MDNKPSFEINKTTQSVGAIVESLFSSIKGATSSQAFSNISAPQAAVIVALIYGSVAIYGIAQGKDVEIDPVTNRVAAKSPCNSQQNS